MNASQLAIGTVVEGRTMSDAGEHRGPGATVWCSCSAIATIVLDVSDRVVVGVKGGASHIQDVEDDVVPGVRGRGAPVDHDGHGPSAGV